MLSVSREDRGAYTCRAYSIQGEAVHTTRLLVQGETFQLLSIPWEAGMGGSHGPRSCGVTLEQPPRPLCLAWCWLPCGSASGL